MTKTSFPKDKIKIVLLEGIHSIAKEKFAEHGYNNVEIVPTALPEEALIEKLKNVKVVGVRSKTQLTRSVIERLNLLAVGCFCIGTNQVDLNAAAQKGIAVFNSPYSNTRSVAELVIAEMVMLLRRIPEKSAAAHRGEWLKTAENAYELRGKTLGIVGYGHIGSQVSILAEAFGLNVIYYDIEPKLPLGNAKNSGSLENLLSSSDIVTLHVPADEGTKNLANHSFFDKMKNGAYFLNLSRGSVVEIKALADQLENGKIKGAAVDVYPSEPKGKGEKFISELQNLSNVILTPHIGGSTQEAQYNIGIDASYKLCNYLDNGVTIGSHSLPALNLPKLKETHRILHIHHNVPGVLSKINTLFSENNVNIVSQYLKTNENVGYVVSDIDKTASDIALQKVKDIKETIRARVLY